MIRQRLGNRGTIRRKFRSYLLELLQKEDAPLRISVGFALGSCVNFFPTFGFGLPLAIIVAFLTRTSIISSIIGENLFKILFPVFLFFDVVVGGLLIPMPDNPWSLQSILKICTEWQTFAPYARVFLVGALANSAIAGSILTGVMYLVATRYKERVIHYLQSREEETG